MRIAKNINYKNASSIDAFEKLKDRIGRVKEKNPKYSIATAPLKDINYFLVIECKDVSEELGFGKEDNNGVAFAFFNEKERHKKFLTHIRKKNSQPSFFKKIGLLYNVSGCYLVATTKTDRKRITINKSSNTVSCKLDMNKLPVEIENMCFEFEEYQAEKQKRKLPELEDIFGLTMEERERIIESIVSGIALNNKQEETIYPDYNYENIYSSKEEFRLNLEQVIESKIDEIYDIPFIEHVMEGAIKKEKFELCSKLRDRINFLKNIK